MKTTDGIKRFIPSSFGRTGSVAVAATSASVLVFLLLLQGSRSPAVSESTSAIRGSYRDNSATPTAPKPVSGRENSVFSISKSKLVALGLEIQPVCRGDWPRRLKVTGQLELNSSRLARVSPLVNGVVREICVELGQEVKAGMILAYIDSREVGEAKLKFTKSRLDLQAARKNCDWYETIHENTCDLLAALEDGQSISMIEEEFRNRPIGAYREQLVSALARLEHTTADHRRVQALGTSGVIPEKQRILTKAEYESATATYQALHEQIRFSSQRQVLLAQQALKAAETAHAISRSQLLILGYRAGDIEGMDPIAEGQRVAYYPVRSPLDGTVIARHVVRSDCVEANSEFMTVADLSSVWLRADVFEKDLGAVRGLKGKSITFRTTSYPGREFSAEVFSLGDIVEEKTRAVRLLAVADNPERLLKPGMFVAIELSGGCDDSVAQIPASAVQHHEGAAFVFVPCGDTTFERRDVDVGRATADSVEVKAGLDVGEPLVVRGGFALKSEMLSELMVEE